jgi:hypothetical protein
MAEKWSLTRAYNAVRREPFTFEWEGQDWQLPHFGDIDWRAAGLAGDLEALTSGGETATADVPVETLQSLFRYAFGPEQAERWERAGQPGTAMVLLFQHWQEHAGADVGEPSASTGSSPSTGRPSKRTSPGITGSGSRTRSSARPKPGTARAS